MNTMEITKYVGAFCGSLLVFLLISTVAGSIFATPSNVVAYSFEVPEEEAAPTEDEAPAEEVDVATLVADADAGAGEGVFRKCAACHKLNGANGVGPHLNGVIGREVAMLEDFEYSTALSEMGGAWTSEEMFGFLENPREYVPGTAMAFAGLASAEDRADVIAYLETTSE